MPPPITAMFSGAPFICRASGRPGERREMPVIAGSRHVEVDAEGVDTGFLRARQGEAAVRRMTGIVDVERVAAAVARRHALDLEAEKFGDHGAPGQPGNGEFDRL